MEGTSKGTKSVKKKVTKKTVPVKKKSGKPSPIPAKLPQNRAIQISGDLCFMVHRQPGAEDQECYMQSQISVSFEDGIPGHSSSDMALLSPERTKLLLKILNFPKSEFVKKYYGLEKE